MKNVLFIAIVLLLGFGKVNAQETSFGIKAGYHNLIAVASANGTSASDGISGIYLGFLADISISEKMKIQPELQYARVSENGGEGNSLIIPVMFKYYVTDQLNFQAGPVMDLILDESEDDVNTFGFGLGAGIGYDFTDKVFITGRYSFGLSDRLEVNDPLLSGVSVRFDIFQVGLGYRF